MAVHGLAFLQDNARPISAPSAGWNDVAGDCIGKIILVSSFVEVQSQVFRLI
jgi:hypothetical protein